MEKLRLFAAQFLPTEGENAPNLDTVHSSMCKRNANGGPIRRRFPAFFCKIALRGLYLPCPFVLY